MDAGPAANVPSGSLSTADIRDANRSAVYEVVRAGGVVSRAELVERSGLARPTVVAIVQELLTDRLVVEAPGRSSPRGGRPTGGISVNTRTHTVAAVRLAGRHVEVVHADAAGRELSRSLVKRPPESAPWTELVANLAAHLGTLDAAAAGPLSSVAVALPGSIDRAAGRWSLKRKPGWRDIPVADLLEARLHVPVSVINIASATLLGHLSSPLEHPSSTALIYVGRGVGGAFTVDGRLVDGATGGAAELGHCHVPGLTVRCPCGRQGCVEAVTRLPHLAKEFVRITGQRAPATIGGMEAHPSAEVAAMLAAAADQLGLAASWLVNLVNPGTVVLGGDRAVDAPRFLARLEESLRRNGHAPNVRLLRVSAAAPDSAVVGTVRLATELLPAPVAPRMRLAGAG